MISYDLKCLNGHVFEGWFENEKAFKKQKRKHMISCPVCGSEDVDRTPSTFGIVKQRPQENGTGPTANHMQQIVNYVRDNFEDVGSDFAKEALKMHYGVTDTRNIRGVSTDKEEDTLREEGVPFFKLPVPESANEEEE
jgi:hypothetical protein